MTKPTLARWTSLAVVVTSALLVWLGVPAVETREASAKDEPIERIEIGFRIVDVATDRIVPAVACLRDADSGDVLLPPDGRVLESVSRTDVFYRGIDYSGEPGWIGPVRKMQGRGDNNDRSYVYENRPSIPYWREPVSYQVEPEFSVSLPAGRYRLSVARGPEFVPRDVEFTVGAGQPREHTISLERWVHLANEGWFSGDVHVHHPTREKAHREFLLRYAEAEDLHVVNVLEMGHHRGTDFKQAGFGKAFRVRRGDRWLVSGQEEPRSNFGHIIGLNTTGLVRDVSTYDFYDLAFDGIHAQKQALVGFAHFSWNGCALPRGFPWYVTTEAVDFVELLQFGLVNELDYADYLNLGFRLSAAAGSDIPWGSSLGEVRTYVKCGDGGSFEVDAWFEGLRQGRTFVSNGPALDLTVDGKGPGAELARERAGTVKVRVRARGSTRVGLPEKLELVGSPGVLAETKRRPGTDDDLVIDTGVPVANCRWLAARTRCDNGAVAHTSPVYIVVDGEPTWSAEQGPAIIEKQLASIARIEAEFSRGDDARSRGVRERLARAKGYYAKLLDAMRSRAGG